MDSGDFAGGRRAFERAVALYASLPSAGQPASVARDRAFALKRLGAVLMRAGDFAASEQRYLEALALDEEVTRSDDRPATRYDITFTMSDLALVKAKRGHWDDAEAMWMRALAIRQKAVDDDPKNTRALSGVAVLYGRLGLSAMSRHDAALAVNRFRTELGLRSRLMAATGPLPARLSEIGWAKLRLANVLLGRVEAERRHRDREAWEAEARQLVASVRRSDGAPSVTAGSEPEFVRLYDRLRARLRTP